ncbi:hypothetical protein Nepgr_017542 [Nepenthes gracilis]|uniref:Translation initiation factor eIF2B subunit beta n=14 Tax=Mesangiospermae TaxID=1437183 RepID=A0AAD3SS86_NEPGR|nr:hypothetical protein Nepgr_017542 [Nepenthes gracilis]
MVAAATEITASENSGLDGGWIVVLPCHAKRHRARPIPQRIVTPVSVVSPLGRLFPKILLLVGEFELFETVSLTGFRNWLQGLHDANDRGIIMAVLKDDKKNMPDVQVLVNDFVNKLRKRKIEGSQATARQTAELLRSVISQQRVPYTNQAGALIDAIKAVGEKLIAANPIELAVGNIVRRVLHIIREEDLSITTAAIDGLSLSAVSDDDNDEDKREDLPVLSAAVLAAASRSTLRPPSLQTLLEGVPDAAAIHHTSSSGGDSEGKSKSADKSSRSRKLKHDVIEAVNELIQDISTCHEQIAEQAVEHIHQNEVILTLGRSRTVMEFLCAAKEKKRSFRVFVAEGAPRYQGHVLAKELVARGLQTTVITDSAVFAMISRVNMVIVGAHAIMANGGLIAPVGLNMVALAAQRHAVPFVVVAGSHKLCPLYPHNPEIVWICEVLLVSLFFTLSIPYLIMCHQSLLLSSLQTPEGITHHICTGSLQITTPLMIWLYSGDLLVEIETCLYTSLNNLKTNMIIGTRHDVSCLTTLTSHLSLLLKLSCLHLLFGGIVILVTYPCLF